MKKTKQDISLEKAEADRDLAWVGSLELYVPTVKDVYSAEDASIEAIIAHFVTKLREEEQKRAQMPFGQVYLNLP